MKFLNGNCYVEVNDKRDNIHPSENVILRHCEEPNSLRTQSRV